MTLFAENVLFVRELKDLLDSAAAQYFELSRAIGDQVKQHSSMVQMAINELFKIVGLAAVHSEPDQSSFMALIKPLSDQIGVIQEYREKSRASPWFNHLSAISESIGAFGWITVKPTPAPYVKEMIDASQFYTNKVLVAFKDKDQRHTEWAKSWINFLQELQKYIRKHHTTGLVWNARGSPLKASSIGGPPPPPPPPVLDFSNDTPNNKSGDDTRSALLKQLNKGTDITKGLKKIDSSQQTHKNPALRNQGPTPNRGSATSVHSNARQEQPQKPPRFDLEGKKWMIEYQVGRKDLVVKDTEMSQSVNVYKCKDSLIIVKGKVNSITVDSCTKTSLVFDDIVSVVEFVNCQNVQAQSMGCVPTINVEKTDVVEVYLNDKSMNAEIVTAKSSSVNVSVPDKTGDFVSYTLQFLDFCFNHDSMFVQNIKNNLASLKLLNINVLLILYITQLYYDSSPSH